MQHCFVKRSSLNILKEKQNNVYKVYNGLKIYQIPNTMNLCNFALYAQYLGKVILKITTYSYSTNAQQWLRYGSTTHTINIIKIVPVLSIAKCHVACFGSVGANQPC